MNKLNNPFLIFTVDVEDWFQVENLKQVIKREEWEGQKLRVIENTQKLLSILNNYGIKATFFVLGWIAEKVPQLIYQIHKLGHEIASHGYEHELINNLSRQEFRNDLIKSKRILEKITGQKILGYRAPSFSITEWAIDILYEEGFRYDSSLVQTFFHDRYGKIENINSKQNQGIIKIRNNFYEVPISFINFLNRDIPWGGGGYFRVLPYAIFKYGVNRILTSKKYYLFYFHPWEIDSFQPKIKNIKWSYKFRHYYGLNRAEDKLIKLLNDFSFKPISEVLQQ